MRFQSGCREGYSDIAFVNIGMNLQLWFTPAALGESDLRVPTEEYVNFDREPGKVHLKSKFILNGVCVRWRGWIDLQRLEGLGCIEFDEETAQLEDQLLREQLEQYNQRLRDFEERQRLYREEQEQQAELEAQHRRAMADIGSPSTTSTCSD